MSGGVDSSAAVILLKDDFDVVGVTLKLFDYADEEKRGCCTEADAVFAAQAAAKCGIPHYTFNYTELFTREVIEKFSRQYIDGLTPNPCIDCNTFVKFGALFDRADELGCDYIATGHYAVCEFDQDSGRYLLKKSPSDKDQSYVLYTLTQENLSRVLFPLGAFTDKAEVRRLAFEHGFENHRKPDSQDICFVPDGDYAAFLRRFAGVKSEAGDFISQSGEVIGRHGGHLKYTIGQRRGLGVGFGKPMYVCGKNPQSNEVVLTEESGLSSGGFVANQLNWIAIENLDGNLTCKVKTRYRQAEVPCEVTSTKDGGVRVEYAEPQKKAAPGQRAVFYDGNVVIGGGVIVGNL